MTVEELSYEKLGRCLLNLKEPIGKRTRAVFYLRTKGGEEAVRLIANALENKEDSALMRHELAYVLGQLGRESACSYLERVLRDVNDDVMVRHEAAEALGAIGSAGSLAPLQEFCNDPAPEVSETCEIALDRVRWCQSKQAEEESTGLIEKSKYHSVDPAPPVAMEKNVTTSELRSILLDTTKPLFERYRAMFSLRNRGTVEDVLALADGFSDKSALFRHEVAYVFGQMMHPSSVPSLITVLEDAEEHRMVRHEAAEALGAIGTPECEAVLEKYKDDDEIVVKESCEVALDIIDYWTAES